MAPRLEVVGGAADKFADVRKLLDQAESVIVEHFKPKTDVFGERLDAFGQAQRVLRVLRRVRSTRDRDKKRAVKESAQLLKRAADDAVILLRGELRDLEVLSRKKKGKPPTIKAPQIPELQGDEPSLLDQISGWVKLGSAASAIFASVATFVMLWLAYKFFIERR